MDALDSVRLIQQAQNEAATWRPQEVRAVMETIPAHLHDRYTGQEWLTTVAVFRQDHETILDAAERLAQYLALHRERHDTTPSLASVQKRAAQDRLEG